MASIVPDLIKDLIEINRRPSLGIWNISNVNTQPSSLSPRLVCPKTMSMLFCFCIKKQQTAYMRHFFYEPARQDYEEYVGSFFISSKHCLDEDWIVFSQGTARRESGNKQVLRKDLN